MESTTFVLFFILLFIDFIIILFIFLLYIKIQKILNLPWDEIGERIDRAKELVEKLEKLTTKKTVLGKNVDNKNLKERVIELHNKGLSIKEIAKKLDLTEGEVELIISAKRLKK